ncbi:hypothetical protein P170DRAFT_4792 [Aspergillus steynii IBT 23096]|uniref:Uncharacterized protein n=1 Tax=Aspergillus steynii IBT 23096 TaxID=1392250 RepID=A0A2I2GLN8_9EURO|nr:uncharacterized protein P170DRAFT_4792 [Aspergillus steynii IBT 23096]PLB53785.1 hypothetical protein P170DRAFT_4792 [Aspergillus steynii IBT 23096]
MWRPQLTILINLSGCWQFRGSIFPQIPTLHAGRRCPFTRPQAQRNPAMMQPASHVAFSSSLGSLRSLRVILVNWRISASTVHQERSSPLTKDHGRVLSSGSSLPLTYSIPHLRTSSPLDVRTMQRDSRLSTRGLRLVV